MFIMCLPMKAASSTETHIEVTESKSVVTETKMEALEATTVEEVTVHEEVKTTLPASFITKPQSLTVTEGAPAKFTCDFDGEPVPSVTWMHEGKEIVSSHRHIVSTTQYKSTFEISSVETSDEGSYTVVIQNSEGKEEAQFSLTIQRLIPEETGIASPPKVKSPEPRVKSPEPRVKSPEPRVKSPVGIRSPRRITSPEPATSPPRIKSPEPRVKSPELVGTKSPEPGTKSPDGIKSPARMKSPEPVTSPQRVKSPEPRVKSPEDTGIKSPEPRIKSPEGIKSPLRIKSPEPFGSPQRVKSPEMKSPEPRVKSPEFTGPKSPEPRIKSPEGIKSPLRIKSPVPIGSPQRVKSPELKSPEPRVKSPEFPSPKSPEPFQRVKSPPTVKSPTPQKMELLPKIVHHLKAEACEDKVKIFCVAESSVKDVVWYKDEKKLTQSSHHHFHISADGMCSLSIQDVTESDQGEYVCEIIAEGGVSRTSFSFVGQVFQTVFTKITTFVETKTAVHKKEIHTSITKPTFSSGLKDVTASSDTIVKLTVKVIGDPTPTLSWMKDGKDLFQGGKYEIFEEHGLAHLEIYESEVADSGVYKCTATNSAGSSSTTCHVTIQASTKTKIQEQAVLASHAKSEFTEQIVKKEVLYEEVQSYTEVKTSHTQMTMSEGQSLTLKASIPEASNVRWILNGTELANSEGYRYGMSGKDHTLTIKKVSEKEEGIITCEAKTQHGIAKCQFDMTITAKRSQAPSFLEQPKSQIVNEGQNVIFTCEIIGEPIPEIEWLKDSVVVSSTSNIKLSSSKNVHTLEICNASVSDSGKYTIKARNSYGQCSSTSSLNVLALVEEPAKMVVMEKSATAASMHESFSASAMHMASSVQEASFSSSSMAEVKFASMSASSMSSMTSESMLKMSSSSIMEMSSHSQLEGSSMTAITHHLEGAPPKIEALPEDISIEKGKVLTVACAFSGEPKPEIEWTRSGRTLPGEEKATGSTSRPQRTSRLSSSPV
ncbi:hypothetical protein AGOR_G00070440 [Albula goreensis]|uniref:Ig-like domain-containing protein n=1 Tax=Albula goreensis TaxID=1534307 RepID=A0A8T3DQZ9_9TELE|nr:hypothetical protein AGOR_G00070440 [Albula goreensis]